LLQRSDGIQLVRAAGRLGERTKVVEELRELNLYGH
jgi:hypothetical protein